MTARRKVALYLGLAKADPNDEPRSSPRRFLPLATACLLITVLGVINGTSSIGRALCAFGGAFLVGGIVQELLDRRRRSRRPAT